MRIGIDARPLASQLTGIGAYVLNTLRCLEAIDKENEYFLYTHRDLNYQFSNPRWKKRSASGLLSRSGTLYIMHLNRQLESDHIDVFWGTQYILPWSGNYKKVLTVLDLSSQYFPETMTAYNLMIHKLLLKRSVLQADRILAISKFTASSVSQVFSVPPEKIITTYLGVGENYKPEGMLRSADLISRKYNVSKRYILSVSTIEPRKNISSLLKAFKQITSSNNTQLLIAGAKGWKNSAVYELYKDLGLKESQVKFIGYVPEEDMSKLYSGAEALVFPSLYEGFGLTLLEAMACDCPIVTSNTSSLPEVCGSAALYVDPHDIGSITAGIQKILDSNSLREDLIHKGREQVKKFSWDNTARETLSVLEKVIR